MRPTFAWMTALTLLLAGCESPIEPPTLVDPVPPPVADPPSPPVTESPTLPLADSLPPPVPDPPDPPAADPPAPPVTPPEEGVRDYGGTYVLTIVAAGTGAPCAFPDELKRRTYVATIVQNGNMLQVTVSGGLLVRGVDTFPGKAALTSATFSIRPADPWDYGGPEVMEHLSDGTRLYVAGTFTVMGPLTGLSLVSNPNHGGSIIHRGPNVSGGRWGSSAGCPIESFDLVRHGP